MRTPEDLQSDPQYLPLGLSAYNSDVHQGGIFSMHTVHDTTATVGKDGCCALTTIGESQLRTVQKPYALSTSVLKSVW